MNPQQDITVPLVFPDTFLFGTSVASFQVEGNVSNDRKADWDLFIEKNLDQIVRPGENGADWWGKRAHVEEDLKMIAKLGVTIQRLSIEWSRVEPEKGQINKEALQHYRYIINTCKKNNLMPMLTINHFTLPEWVAKRGGWENPEIVSWMESYTSVLLEEFHDINYWIVVNEPSVMVYFGSLLGIFPPNKKSVFSAWRTRENIIKTQQRIYTLIKKQLPEVQVGNAFSFLWFRPYIHQSKMQQYLAQALNYVVNTNFVSAIKDYMDFVGMNYYTGYYVDLKWFQLDTTMRNEALYVPYNLPFARTVRPKSYKTDMGWPIVPDFFLDSLRHVYDVYKKPIFITENGIADRDDIYRPFYILTHLLAVWKAIDQGIDIKGYIHWATVDNLEWLEGFAKRFGLIKVNPLTGERQLQEGAKVYAAIIKKQGMSVEKMIEEFIPKEQKEYAHYVTKQILGATKNHCPRITRLT